MRLGFAYTLAIGVASVTGRVAPLGVMTVRLVATNDCYITIGTNPVATVATGTLMRASTGGELFTIAAGESVAMIAASAGGSLNVTEMTY